MGKSDYQLLIIIFVFILILSSYFILTDLEGRVALWIIHLDLSCIILLLFSMNRNKKKK
ncbi:hypothetical protein [Longirhabdus pacifica]|uniref:hypothetical protein n=1 Tax=Longirhabdus pacifica TaxID=2305227 RepID=UPI0013E8C96F|nr:hypothetical protein [Longirhabdus pacifica]